ncbi:MAG: hypothetical protein HOP08_03220 [Cyclobacteriaceae bacterium]|nr:hypothetical protein [Cyclobacteriaceae bacterium]
MSAIELLNGLQDYLTLLSAVKDREQTFVKEDLSKSVSLSYSFIKLELRIHNGAEDHTGQLYIMCRFEIKSNKPVLEKIYCEKKDREEELKKFILHHQPVDNFPMTTNFNNYSALTHRYFEIADAIAKQGYNCNSGDDYRPGYYSQIIVNENEILLHQINHWNAKSSKHKEDYHLRNLEFTIPLTASRSKALYDEYLIGEMRIHLSNRSSKNNKECGERIREKLLAEKALFEKVELK